MIWSYLTCLLGKKYEIPDININYFFKLMDRRNKPDYNQQRGVFELNLLRHCSCETMIFSNSEINKIKMMRKGLLFQYLNWIVDMFLKYFLVNVTRYLDLQIFEIKLKAD